MDKMSECEIVKDLAIPYTEGLINPKSKEFVDVHLSTCNNCMKYYKDIKSDIFKEKYNEVQEDKIVINQFSKINKKINILKICLISIMIIVLIIASLLFAKYQKNHNVINRSYNQIESMKELNNYKLTVKTIQNNFDTNDQMNYEEVYYYKDGKYKIESDNSIKFYEDNSYEKICVYHDLKQIDYYKQDFIEMTKGDLLGIFSCVLNYKDMSSTVYNLALTIREERYNGIDCYVIRFGNKNSYTDTWINKASFIPVRVVNEVYSDFYREEIYTFQENVVNDLDVDKEILNSEQYKDYRKNEIDNNFKERTNSNKDLQYLFK